MAEYTNNDYSTVLNLNSSTPQSDSLESSKSAQSLPTEEQSINNINLGEDLFSFLQKALEESSFPASPKLVSYEECKKIFSFEQGTGKQDKYEYLSEIQTDKYLNEIGTIHALPHPQYSNELIQDFEASENIIAEKMRKILAARILYFECLVKFLRILNVPYNELGPIRPFLEFIGFNSNSSKNLFNIEKLDRLLQFFSPFLPCGSNKPFPRTICYRLDSICRLLNSGWFYIVSYEVAARRISSPAFDSSLGDFICRLSDSSPRNFTIHFNGNAYSIKTAKEESEEGTANECEYYYSTGLSEISNRKFYEINEVIQAIINEDALAIKLDRFIIKSVKLERNMGSGVSSDIYEATWNGIKVAAKQFKFFSKETFLIDDLWEEAWKLKLANHSVRTDLFTQFYGVYIEKNIKYLITEFIYGKSLEHFVQQEIKSKKILYEILMKIAVGMDLLGKNCKLIHRDLAMRNVMIKDKGFNPVILDFGFSLYFSEIAEKKKLRYDPRISAPEILYKPSIKCDVYSFGCLIFEVLNARLERKENKENDVDYYSRTIHEYYDKIEDPFGKDMFIRCTQIDPSKRPDWGWIVQEFTEQIKNLEEKKSINEN